MRTKVMNFLWEFFDITMYYITKFWIVIYWLIIILFNYTGIDKEWTAILGLLMILDTAFGRFKVVAIWLKPTSMKLKAGVIAKISVMCVPFIISLLFKANWMSWDWIISSSLWLLVRAEWYSIIQNIASIRLGREIEEYDAVTWVLKRILWLFRWIIEQAMMRK